MYDITDKRQAVALLQRYLRRLSYATEGMPHPPIDGLFGEDTRAAVLFFQERRGLTPSGAVGLADWQAIREAYLAILRDEAEGSFFSAASLPLSAGREGTEVFLLQALLAAVAEAYADGVGAPQINGRFDSETGAAVRTYQRRRLLPVSGIADLLTAEALVSDYRELARIAARPSVQGE